jgi:hypothetical protein
MPVSSKTIVIEDVLENIFSYLPDMSFNVNSETYPVTFGYGDKVELNAFLANRDKSTTYPLIWMLYPLDEDHQKTMLVATNVTFVLAVTTNQSMENRERIKLTYGKVLMPLLYNIRTAFKQSNVLTIQSENESFKSIKYPNYSNTESRDESGTIAIWDALRFSVDLEIIDTCIKPIKFF